MLNTLIVIDIFIQGDIFTTEVLDSETRNLYSLVVQAKDNASVPNIAYTMVVHAYHCSVDNSILILRIFFLQVTIAVINVNDNPPKFLLAPYFFTTAENQAPPVVSVYM